jgi:uncharacterized protein YndB with AHSA1/START domain
MDTIDAGAAWRAMFERLPDGASLTLSRVLAYPPEKVWAALTIPARLAAWMGVEWLGDDAPLSLGAAVDYRFTDTGMESRGRVLRFEPPCVLEHGFHDNIPPGAIVRWHLAPEGAGCRLTLTHRFRAMDDAPRTAAGWTQLLNRLDESLGGAPAAGGIEMWRHQRDVLAASFPPEATRDGRAVTIEGCPALRFERRLEHPAEAVWAALTEPDILARWIQAEAVVDRRAGGRFHLVFQGGPHAMHGVITRWDEPRVLEFTWPETQAGGDSLVRFALEADGAHCNLVLTHTLRAGGDRADFASGWHWHLDAIDLALDGQAVAFDAPRWKALKQIYAATL